MDLRINNGVPEWSARGADTWSPFKGNPIKKTLRINTYDTSSKTISGSINVGVGKVLYSDVFPILTYYEWYPTGYLNKFTYEHLIDNSGILKLSIKTETAPYNNNIAPFADFDIYIF